MSENKHTGGSRSGRGYYIALILCAAAIGITSYVYHQNAQTEEEVLLQESQVIPVGTMTAEDLPVLATQPQQETLQTETARPAETQPGPKEKRRIQVPVSGSEIYGYSMETLSYNETTRDWRVHNGVDFAAEAGTPVGAAADGTVSAIYEDDAMGHTVVIRHEGGYTTQYSSLSSAIPVSAGDTVAAGQTIGYVDSTALVETTLGSHVHFSVTYQNAPVDPAAFLASGE